MFVARRPLDATRRGAVSGADAAKIAEVFATVAAPTLAATVAHDRARRAAEAFARMDAAAPPSAIFPDAYPAEAENLPSAIATLFALVAATTPAAAGAGGAAPFAAAIDAAGTALDAALAKAEAAAKAALGDAGARAPTAIRFAPRSRDPRSPTPRRPRDPSAATELSAAATGLSAAATGLSATLPPPPRTVCFIRRGRARAPVRDTRRRSRGCVFARGGRRRGGGHVGDDSRRAVRVGGDGV